MAKNTIRVQNNGVKPTHNIERFQLKKYITEGNPEGDIVKLKFAGHDFIIPFSDWRTVAHRSFFDLYQMGLLGKWKQDPPKSKWDKMFDDK